MNLGYYWARLLSKLKNDNKKSIMGYFAKKGVKFPGGGPVWINSNIAKNEPHLISIGKNTTIAGNVEFVTHDNSISKVIEGTSDLYGPISVGENCFIGVGSIILYGVSIPDNVIVAAGSVVTKSIDRSNVIVGGNPAKIISTWEKFAEKNKEYAYCMNKMSREEMISRTSNGEKVVRR